MESLEEEKVELEEELRNTTISPNIARRKGERKGQLSFHINV